LLAHLEAEDPEIAERLVSRRMAILQGAGTSAAVAAGIGLATAPVALAALARDAFGQSTRLPAVVITVLNFALTLEYLESAFYMKGVASGIIPSSDQAIFNTINTHEAQHVVALKSTLGSSARPSPTFDFTAGGKFPTVFSDYSTFTALAQAFEDTGVRAYKGQAPALMPYKSVLTTALTIHSVEARHAAEVRRLRGGFTNQGPYHKGWIDGAMTDIPGTSGTYAGEDNTVHAGIDLAQHSTASVMHIQEAFDEPLTMAQVLAIAGNFIKP
ncbi:MAG TPA: ferritin-like domain-containing protein, partial [Gemmatirosa sp.]